MENTQNSFTTSTVDLSCIEDSSSLLPLDDRTSSGFCDEQQRCSQYFGGRDVQDNDAIMPNIFVQIPMQRSNPCSSYHSQNNSREIKAEPIKSEVMELGLLQRKAQSPFLLNNEDLVTARVKPTKIHKCKHCAFITISQASLTTHGESHRDTPLEENTGQQMLSCPGCVNLFRTKKSLEVHLISDHEILENELEAIVEFATLSSQTKSPPNSNRSTPKTRPSRIFIKSVDVLRNPVDNSAFNQENHNRIFLKNVNVLRNPDLQQVDLDSELMQQPQNICDPGQFHIEGNNPGIVVSEAQNFGVPGIFGGDDCTPSPVDLDRGDLITITPTSIASSVHSSAADQSENVSQDHQNKIFLRSTDMMKTPVCTETGQNSAFLHLRTVDELNLMNLEDVQNLNRQNTSMSNDNSKHSTDEVVILDDSHIPGNLFNIPSVLDAAENRGENTLTSTLQEIMANYVMTEKDPTKVDDVNAFKNFLSDGQNVDFGGFPTLDNIIESGNYYSPAKIMQFEEQPCFCDSNDTFPEVISDQDPLSDPPRDNNSLFQIPVIPIDDIPSEINTPIHPEVENHIQETSKAPQDDNKSLGRIYVVKNLLEDSKEEKKTKKNIGRPKGARKSGITELKKIYNNITSDEIGTKCDREDCAIRFKNLNNLNYHRQCHSTENYGIMCPECKNTDFRNWNTLHTHLWREHQIDMELYSCEFCNFKTPILSRLKNTHVKIHSEERNFKCELCEKRFKNTKQLKNHRRIHRSATEQLPVRKCEFCPATVVTGRQYKKHLKAEHECPGGHTCGVCGKSMNSMAALKIHERKHSEGGMFSCNECDYTTHDYNAARRHRMKHGTEKQYKCPFCGYTSIQSTTYRSHLVKMHPEQADSLIFKCTKCSFETINLTKHRLHVAKHDSTPEKLPGVEEEDILEILSDATEPSVTPPLNPTLISPSQKHNKIKVKSNLVLRDPSKFINTNNLLLQNLQPHQMLPTPPTDTGHHQHLPLIRPAFFAKTFAPNDASGQMTTIDPHQMQENPLLPSPQYPNIDLT
ncbi:hypothetical protein DMENIID0001_084590 [Sergentomyia squamirostris]